MLHRAVQRVLRLYQRAGHVRASRRTAIRERKTLSVRNGTFKSFSLATISRMRFCRTA